MMKPLIVSLLLLSVPVTSYADSALIKDCSEVFGKPSACKVIRCSDRHQKFIGTWQGPFSSYSRELSNESNSIFRPFNNTVTYSEEDCLENVENGDSFIMGRRTDVYPEFEGLPGKTVKGLLVTGRKKDGTLFLRTVDEENGICDFKLEYRNLLAGMTVWSFVVPESDFSPAMRFTTIDAQDQTMASELRMNVTVTMSIGPADAPYWEGVVTKGYHALSAR